MNKLILIIAIVYSGMLMQAQSYSAKSNYITSSGQTGNWNNCSFTHTFKSLGDGNYKIMHGSGGGSIIVKYSHMEKGMYVYLPNGDNVLTGTDKVQKVMSEDKLSKYTFGSGTNKMYFIQLIYGDGLAYKLI